MEYSSSLCSLPSLLSVWRNLCISNLGSYLSVESKYQRSAVRRKVRGDRERPQVSKIQIYREDRLGGCAKGNGGYEQRLGMRTVQEHTQRLT